MIFFVHKSIIILMSTSKNHIKKGQQESKNEKLSSKLFFHSYRMIICQKSLYYSENYKKSIKVHSKLEIGTTSS